MKKITTFLSCCFCFLLFTNSLFAQDFDCIDLNLINLDLACTADYDPVCGCDGVTYSNQCVATVGFGVTSSTPGECSGSNPNYEVCAGNSSQIGETFVPNVVYNWSPTEGLSCINCADPVASPLQTTVYTLSTTTTVSLNSAPFVSTHTVNVDWSCANPNQVINTTHCTTDGTFNYPFFLVPTFGGGDPNLTIENGPVNGSASLNGLIQPGGVDLSYTPQPGFTGIDKIYISYLTNGPVDEEIRFIVELNITVEQCGTECIDLSLIDPLADCVGTYIPVCGCDGVTYTNECLATYVNGISSFTAGECSPINETCFDPTVIIPDAACTEEWDPVCGCDGNTYSNICHAYFLNGITMYTQGACESSTCDLNNMPWLNNLLSGLCQEQNTLFVDLVESGGTQYVLTQVNSTIFPNAQNTLYACDGSIVCAQSGFIGSEDCDGIIYNSTFVQQLWSTTTDCSACLQTPDHGDCQAAFSRWYYNSGDKECYQFAWGGCESTANNFGTYDLCISSCQEPCICPAVFDPVCGSDGMTYGNSCEAACANVSWTPGECLQKDCFDSSLILPNIDCSLYAFEAVCGCDGVTYSNICDAYFGNGITSYTAGACQGNQGCNPNAQWIQDIISNACDNGCQSSVEAIEYQGTEYIAVFENHPFCSDGLTVIYNCDGSEACLDGGFAGFNQCPDLIQSHQTQQVLWTFNECNGCDLCPDFYAPVCGSDGVEYSNDCLAECAGVTWTPGNCDNEDCFDFSHYEPDFDCSPDGFEPVCGCDGVTYYNTCEAYWNNALVSYTAGPCLNECICTADYNPVCGADGLTYSNSCGAECAGVSWTAGECDDIVDGCFDPNIVAAVDCSGDSVDPVCGCNDQTYQNICEAYFLNGITSYQIGACGSAKAKNSPLSSPTAEGLPLVICLDENKLNNSIVRGSGITYENALLRFFDNCVQYVPNPEFSGTDNITIKWFDANGLSEVVNYDVRVKSTNIPRIETVESMIDVYYDQLDGSSIWFENNSEIENTEYHIFNIAGKVIYKGETSTSLWSVNIDAWQKGIYVIRTPHGSERFMVR